ncbi:hypothetical protein HA402_005034 [Bradysia odoriphaga]|nr:hypothetical protein HA402_005034 [Bradysia odoriphaga]
MGISTDVTNNFCNSSCNNNICLGHANNTVVPNNDSCTQFFICTDGHPQPNTCPTGQWFNQIELTCDSSENDKCNPSDEFKCPAQGIFFFPHEKYCDKYIMCYAGFPILSHCADGLYFDRESLKCDKPEVAECKMEKCPINDGPFELIFLPSDVDCEKYYICYKGDPMEQYCAPGIHWNAVTNQCDFAENVNCTYVKPAEPVPPQPHEIPCANGIYFEGHPNSCEHYFICSFGV